MGSLWSRRFATKELSLGLRVAMYCGGVSFIYTEHKRRRPYDTLIGHTP